VLALFFWLEKMMAMLNLEMEMLDLEMEMEKNQKNEHLVVWELLFWV